MYDDDELEHVHGAFSEGWKAKKSKPLAQWQKMCVCLGIVSVSVCILCIHILYSDTLSGGQKETRWKEEMRYDAVAERERARTRE